MTIWAEALIITLDRQAFKTVSKYEDSRLKILEKENLQDIPAARKALILKYIKTHGSASIKDLSILQNVSEATIRRDLDEMSLEGVIKRTRGGAILPTKKSTSFEHAYREKAGLMVDEKKAIGKFAASYVKDGDTIFLDSGTTSFQIGQNLADKKYITVITYDLFIANSTLLDVTSTLIVTGGIRRSDFGVLIGPMVQEFIRNIRVDKVFLTADSVDINFGVSNAGFHEMDIKKQSILCGQHIYLTVDHSKFGQVAMARVCPLQDVGEIIVDSGLPIHIQEALTRENIKFTLVC